MKRFRCVVVPVDGSAAATRGVAFAAEVARSEGSQVSVCSAIDEAAVMLPIAEGALINPMPVLEAMEADVAKNIAAAVRSLQAAGVVADGTVLRGSPVTEIDAFARRQHADAIVMGTSGRSGVERMVMGSVTSALLRIADIAVITVHADDTLERGPLLVALDSSAASLGALDCAIDRARASGSSLQLVHVFEERKVDQLSSAIGVRPQSAQRQALTDAEDALDEAADRVRSAGVPFTTEIVRGTAVESILAVAQRRGARGIAIGTHGRGALERFFLGSVAEGVIRNAHVPVLIVHRRSPKRNRVAAIRHEPAARETFVKI